MDNEPIAVDVPVDSPAKPVAEKPLKAGEIRVRLGGADGKSFEFITKPEDVSVQVGDWTNAQLGRFDRVLLSAFETVMRSEGRAAGKPAYFEDQFNRFARKEV